MHRWEDDGGFVPRPFVREPKEHGMQKRCSRCEELRPIGWYVRRGIRSSGTQKLSSECRECAKPDHAHEAAKRRSRLAVGYERVTMKELRAIGDSQGWICPGCGRSCREEWSIDHKQAIARGGTHTRSNIQLMHKHCNAKKGAR
jgi:hypothetical protein